eukprot:GFUD01033422.1.p1 GENE.GFUD01033422.1~~GFUD01033422.1.p1  ORF type:complete len:204 (-),score=54.21 GFUD01033422.1:95-706(-)
MGQLWSGPTAGTPCGRLICDYPGPRPKYQGTELDLPDILVFHVPTSGREWCRELRVVPSYLTEDPKLVGKTRHQQAIEIIQESQSKLKRDLEDDPTYNLPTAVANLPTNNTATDMLSAGSVQGGEPKTQSCTVNNIEGNQNFGQEGQMEEKQRDEFLEVWAEMVKTGQDKDLREIIEKKRGVCQRVRVKDKEWQVEVYYGGEE